MVFSRIQKGVKHPWCLRWFSLVFNLKHLFSQSLHFVGKEALRGKGKANFKGKLASEGLFRNFLSEGKFCLKRCLG